MRLVRENPTTYNIMIFDFTDCEDRCHGQPGRFPITGTHTFITLLSEYTRYTLYGSLTAVDYDMDKLTSNSMLNPFHAASSLTEDVYLCILGHIIGGCIGSIAAD